LGLFLKAKSEVCGPFKKFKALVDKKSGYSNKALMSNQGGECTSKEFETFCKANGIRHFLIIPRSPQQNSVVEWKNRTILNIVQSILKNKSVPKQFWAEAITCAVYLSNLSSSRSVHDMTPQEAWSNKKPSVSYLHIFGSIGYIHVLDEKRSKLNEENNKLSSLAMIQAPNDTSSTIPPMEKLS